MMAMTFSGAVGEAMRRVEEADQSFLAFATGGVESSEDVDEDEAA